MRQGGATSASARSSMSFAGKRPETTLPPRPDQPVTGRVYQKRTPGPRWRMPQATWHRPDRTVASAGATAADGTYSTWALGSRWSTWSLPQMAPGSMPSSTTASSASGVRSGRRDTRPDHHCRAYGTGVDFALPPRVLGFLAVRVVDRTTGLPLEDYHVTTEPVEGRTCMWSTDAAGLSSVDRPHSGRRPRLHRGRRRLRRPARAGHRVGACPATRASARRSPSSRRRRPASSSPCASPTSKTSPRSTTGLGATSSR